MTHRLKRCLFLRSTHLSTRMIEVFLFFSLVHLQVVYAEVNVILPVELTKPNGYNHLTARFGTIPYGYGRSIQANVVYAGADNDMCTPLIQSPWMHDHPFILMIDRGGCTFVQKVRNAQHAGATAVIIADNACLCNDVTIGACTLEPNESCARFPAIMADDGSGGDIVILSVLLFKQDADPIKEYIRTWTGAAPVRMELHWPVLNRDERVEWEMWTSPSDATSQEFLIDFQDAVMALGNRAFFTPRMFLFDGLSVNCQRFDGQNVCSNLCTNVGRYCAPDPDNDLNYGISGADVIRESVLRICIWELYGEDGIGQPWWNYIKTFENKCNSVNNFSNDECIKSTMLEVGIEYDDVKSCIVESGGLATDAENSILENQLFETESKNIITLPFVYVNGIAIGGQLDFVNVFNAICAGYTLGTAPLVCNQCINCLDEKKCVSSGVCGDSTALPTEGPSAMTSMQPTNEPSLLPSIQPSSLPSSSPSIDPSVRPERSN